MCKDIEFNIEKTKDIVTKSSFYRDNKFVFKLIHKVLGNVVFEYQLKELMFLTKYIEDEEEFEEFLVQAVAYDLLKKPDDLENTTNKEVYIIRDYVIKKLNKKYPGSYKYKHRDALTSYYKMWFILGLIKDRTNSKIRLDFITKMLIDFGTFDIDKSAYLRLYENLNEHDKLNDLGEIRLNELTYYENRRLLNFKNTKNNPLLKNEVYIEKLKSICNNIKSNKHYWDYNLGKISDNKSYFLYFNPLFLDGFKTYDSESIGIVKFDVSDVLKNAELADYVAKSVEGIKGHIKEDCKKINFHIYFSNEENKKKVFDDCFKLKVTRAGVSHLDSNFTARIKETLRKDYAVRLVSLVDIKVDFDNYRVTYKTYFTSQKQDPDNYYLITINFNNCDIYNDLYSKDELKKKEEERRLKRKDSEAKNIVNDPELMLLIKKYLETLQNV